MLEFALAGALTGVASHLMVFKRLEVADSHPMMVLSSIAIGQLSIFAVLYGRESAFKTSLAYTGSFIGSLWLSIIMYRLFWHPLRKFPGPVLARTTKLWTTIMTIRSGLKWHRVQAELKEQYGDFVRAG
jgi:cellulose synthase/poly-beta-1,6-N-acetylglucosamine synthase-like glycosyltransferase